MSAVAMRVEFLTTTRLGEKGQLTVPKEYRDDLRLEAGASICIPLTRLRNSSPSIESRSRSRKRGAVSSGKNFDHLLGCPGDGLMSRDIEMNDSSSVVLENDEAVKVTEGDSWGGEKINANDLTRVIEKEGFPGLRWGLDDFAQIFGDGRLGHIETE